MADFNLTQTDAQVQSILDDAQDAMGAGAQTSLTTDYIMLKGTNGRYHKILKDSFTEAVRNTLAGLLVNNDKGTTISQIAAIASGDFGSVTPANLASVLGVFKNQGTIPAYSNVFELTLGIWVKGSSSTNVTGLPTGEENTNGFVLSFRENNQRICLIFITSAHVYYYIQLGATASTWKTIY